MSDSYMIHGITQIKIEPLREQHNPHTFVRGIRIYKGEESISYSYFASKAEDLAINYETTNSTAQLCTRVDELHRDNTLLNATIDTLNEDLDVEQERRQTADSACSTLENEIILLKRRIDTQFEVNDNRLDEIDELKEEAQAYEADIEVLNASIEGWKSAATKAKQETFGDALMRGRKITIYLEEDE